MDVLANWLWQGCAVALAATVILHTLPRISATTRYRAWWVALVMVLLLPMLPTLVAFGQPEPVTSVPNESPAASLTVTLPQLPWWPIALILAVWMLWLAGSLLRVIGAVLSLRRAKAVATSFPETRESRLQGWLSVRGTGRHASLVVSEEVRSAGVLGLRAPAIAVSPVTLHELSNRELDQILVHEWAHVQRRDDIGRLCQVLVTAVVGLHPAVCWINRQLHIERETACDDWTVNLTGAPKRYAACLTKLAAMGNDGVLVPSAWSSSSLRTRILRVLDRTRDRSTRFTVASLAIAPVLAAIALTVASVELVVSRPLDLPPIARVVRTVHTAEQTVTAPIPTAPKPKPVPAPQRLTVSFVDGSDRSRTASGTPLVAPTPAPMSTTTPVTTTTELALPPAIMVATETPSLPGASTLTPPPESAVADAAAAAEKSVTPWSAATNASVELGDAGVAIGDAVTATGVAVGRGSKQGAVATAGFFTRMGKSIARSF